MKLRLLLGLPFVLAAALIVLFHYTSGLPSQTWIVRIEIESLKLLALIGCWAAASAFDRNDYLWRAWFLSGLCYAFLLFRDLTLGAWTPWAPGPHVLGVPTEILESALVLLGNVAAVWGVLLLARAWTVAGLGEADSIGRRRTLFIVALMIALVVVGNNMRHDLDSLASGNLNGLVGIASDVGDIVSLALIAPVLLTALALRGGLLLWPWALLTASMIGWLFFDTFSAVGQVMRGTEDLKLTGEIFRSFACSFSFSAGCAQRMVLGKRA